MSASTLSSGCISLKATPSSGGAPLAVTFTGEGFDQGHAVSSYQFDFGDASGGQASSVKQAASLAEHRYYNPGTYTAKLSIQDSSGTWKTNVNCQSIISVGRGTGTTSVKALPSTGISDFFLPMFTLLVIIGIVMERRFRLRYFKFKGGEK